MSRTFVCRALLVVLGALVGATPVGAADRPPEPVRKLVATEGKGYLETIDGYRVLHLKGTPEEMGLQHGRLLKAPVTENVAMMLAERPDDAARLRIGDLTTTRGAIAETLRKAFADKVPEAYMKEMRAVAEGAGLPPEKIIASNLIPEMFHCSGFALLARTTADGKLYHGRVLDYGVGKGLQGQAVLILQEPDGKVPFANVSYAGFIGSVTGMNAVGISVGEMGGGGIGLWKGIPMAFLMRMALEDAHSLDEAIGIFRANPRTCEYYYVLADARADKAAGLWATPDKVDLIGPGQAHPLLPTPIADTVILSAGDRYKKLVERIREGLGKFTPESALRLMDAPVAMGSNLHDVLMIPADGVLYVANAGKDGSPAWKQTYYRFDVRRLIAERPKTGE